jgi:non-heme chloroperoxidase
VCWRVPLRRRHLPGRRLGNPANRNRAVPPTYDQFRYAFANAVSEDEAKQLYETYSVPTAGKPLFQAATAT